MGTTEVTKAQWDATYTYAIANSYSFDNVGSGKASTHPVQTVSWYDVVKWCNAKSQQDGLLPCYYSGAAIYKTGQIFSVTCDFTKNGYRLPIRGRMGEGRARRAERLEFSVGSQYHHPHSGELL